VVRIHAPEPLVRDGANAPQSRASFGRWPRSVLDDSKDVLIQATAYPLLLSVFSVVLVVPATLILLAMRQASSIRPTFDKWAGAALVGAVVYYLVVLADPFGYLNWLLD
jgi:hypothetical protein